MSHSLSYERHSVPHRPAPAPASPAVAPVTPAHAGAGHSFSQIAVSAPGDPAEQQADAFAAEIMRTDAPSLEHASLGAFGASGADAPPDDAPDGRALSFLPSDGPLLQRKEAGPTPPQSRADVGLSSGGTPLDPATRAFMEPRFGHDFSHVRIHTGADAAQASDSLAARAFTVGSDIAFRLGEYSPGTSSGKELLAHELTHVVQQRGGRRGVQRKPVPAWQGPVKPGGVNVGSADVKTFEAAAAGWLGRALDNSERVLEQEKAKLGLTKGTRPTDGGAGMKQLQQQARQLADMQDLERQAESQAADVLYPVHTSLFDGADATDWAGRNKAANSDPTVQNMRRVTLAKQRQLGKTNPILLSSEINFSDLGHAAPEKGAEIAHERIAQVEKAIKDCRAALGSGSLTIWDLPELIPSAMQQLGIVHRTPLGEAIEKRMLDNEKKKTDHEYWLAAFQLGLGLASLLTAGAGMMVAGGLSEGTMVATGAATTVPSLINDGYSIGKDLHEYNQGKMLANTHLDQKASLKTEQPSLTPLAGDVLSTVVDVIGGGMLIRDAAHLKQMRGLATDIEQVVDRAAPGLSKHAPQEAHAEIKRLAAKEADALIAENRLNPKLKGKFVEATEKVWSKKFGKALHIQAEGAHPAAGHPAGGTHPEGVGHLAAEAHPTAGHPAPHPEGAGAAHPTPHPVEAPPKPFKQPTIGQSHPSYPVAAAEAAPKPAITYAHDANGVPLAHHTSHSPAKAAHAEPIAPVETASAPAETITPPAEPPKPEIKTTADGTQVTVAEDGSKTIARSDGSGFESGKGWHDAEGKRITPETVYRDQAGTKITKAQWREQHGLAPAEPIHAGAPAAAAEAPTKPFSVKSRADWEAMREQTGQAPGKPAPSRRGLRGANDDGKLLYSSEEGHAGPVSEPPKPVETTGAAPETGGKKSGPYQDPSAEFPHGETVHAPAKPVKLADMTQIDQARARLNALKEQKEFHVQYDDVWSGTDTQVGQASRSASALDSEINQADTALKNLEKKANLPEGMDMRAKLANSTEDPIALINENQSWSRLGELNLGENANRRLLAARDAIVMRLKTEIEEEFHVFIHAGDGNRIIDKVTAGKVTTDVDLVVTPRAVGDEVAQAKLGQGSLESRPAQARAELQRRLNEAFSGDSNRVAMVNVFMGDKRLPFLSAEGTALKAAQDTEGMVEGLRGIREVSPELYEAQKASLLNGAGKDDPVRKLVKAAEDADQVRVDNINKALAEKNIDPARATPEQKIAAGERVRQQKEIETQTALHAYEAKRGGMTDEQVRQASPEFQKELDQLAVAHNKAVQELAIYTPEAYTPHGALEVPLSKREIAIGTIEDDLSKPMVANKDGKMVPAKKDLTLPVAAQSAQSETRMFLDVLHHIHTPVNQAAHCAKYVGRFMNQFLQVLELEKYPLLARLRSTPEAFHLEMVAVKDIGDENAKIRRLMELLGGDNRNPTAVVQQFINESEQMMVDLNTRLVKGALNNMEGIPGAAQAAEVTNGAAAP